MGIYYSVYTGPVLVCKFHMETKTKKKHITTNACANGHKIKGDVPFCSQCGGPNMGPMTHEEERQTQSKSVPHIFDLMNEGGFREDTFEDCWGGLNNESLLEDHDIFAPNSIAFDKFLGKEETSFEANNFKICVRNPDVDQEIAKMKEFYAKEIEYLRSKYDSVDVEWMVLINGR